MTTQVFQLIPSSAIRRDRNVRETTARILDCENLRRKISLILESGQVDRKKLDSIQAQLREEEADASVVADGGKTLTETITPAAMEDGFGSIIDAAAAAVAAAPVSLDISRQKTAYDSPHLQPPPQELQDDVGDVPDSSYPSTVPLRNGMQVQLQNLDVGVRGWIHMGTFYLII